jgi:hypothetical protein
LFYLWCLNTLGVGVIIAVIYRIRATILVL